MFHYGSQRVLWAASSPQLLHGLQQRLSALKVGAHHLVAVHPHLLKQRLLRTWESAGRSAFLTCLSAPISSNSASCGHESVQKLVECWHVSHAVAVDPRPLKTAPRGGERTNATQICERKIEAHLLALQRLGHCVPHGAELAAVQRPLVQHGAVGLQVTAHGRRQGSVGASGDTVHMCAAWHHSPAAGHTVRVQIHGRQASSATGSSSAPSGCTACHATCVETTCSSGTKAQDVAPPSPLWRHPLL